MNAPSVAPEMQRVLLLLGTSRDAKLSCELLEQSRIDTTVCPSTQHLGEELARGTGAILIAEECLHIGGAHDLLRRYLDQQPPWSDLPILVLARPGADSVTISNAMASLGNVTLLERPLRVAALVSVVRTALRARSRQYQIRENLRVLEEARDAEALAARNKDEFLAMLSHELRNPLAPIRTGLHFLALDDSDPQRRASLREMMMRQVDHMVRLVDDLLESSRLSRGKIELQREVIDLRDAIGRAIESSRPMIDGNFAFEVRLPEDPLPVDADLVRMTQVFSNLLNNAAKYGRDGGSIALTVERDGDHVVVQVRDDGIGIDPDLLPHVFEMFAQGKSDTSHKQDGLGIGLSLVQSLVHMHGGTVVVRSEGTGKGAEFSIRLPLAGRTVATTPAVVLPTCRLEGPPTGMRIMVVDDNHDAANSLGFILEALGIETRTAHDGLEGLRLADAFLPSIAILDVGMPGMDGCEVATRLRANPLHANIVLIALTGWGHLDDIDRCRDAGFDHHIRKPADVPALVALLEDIRARMHSSRPLQPATSHAGVQSPC